MTGKFGYINGKFSEILNIDEICEQLKNAFNEQEQTNMRLREANETLKSETYAQDEVARMKQQYDEMKADYFRGFPISKEQDEMIANWQKTHTENIHKAKTAQQKLALEGVSGGRWSFIFVPTAIGTSGVCRCGSCYSKAMKDYETYLKTNNKAFDYDKRRELINLYDAEIEFQELG